MKNLLVSIVLAAFVAAMALFTFFLERFIGIGDDYNILVWNFVLSIVIVVIIINIVLYRRRKKKKKKKEEKKQVFVYAEPKEKYRSEYY
ncbi:MAG: hypothetical protein V1818_00990 [Candidatus Aenigmatarchaeota archaeon]